MEALEGPYMETPFMTIMKKRARWLVLLFLGEMFTATAMGFFEGEISKAVVLALFLPLIISSGGNAGSQSTTLIIRAMALGEDKTQRLVDHHEKRNLFRIIFGVYSGSCWICPRHPLERFFHHLRRTLAISGCDYFLFTNWSCLVGIGYRLHAPHSFEGLSIDPAVSSAPLVATIVDVSGIVI